MTVDAYAAVADRRPRVKQDVLYTQTSAGVLFHNTHGGFQLTASGGYRLACAVVPRLTGERSVSELCSGLPAPTRSVVGELVAKLLDFGFARDVADVADAAASAASETTGPFPPPLAETFAAQLNYIDHYVGRPNARFLAFRDARIAVLGGGEVARTCLLGLVRNGAGHLGSDTALLADPEIAAELDRLEKADCAVQTTRVSAFYGTGSEPWAALDGFDVVVVADASGDSGRRLLALLEAGVPTGVRVLPAVQLGNRIMVGPLTGTGNASGTGSAAGTADAAEADRDAPCWGCALLRLSANDAAGTAELWSGMTMSGVPAAPPPSRPLAAMIGNLLAFEAFRIRTGALPPETEGTVVVQDLDTLDLASENLVRDPRCAFHVSQGDPADPTRDLAGLAPASAPVSTASDADDADPLLAALSDTAYLVQPTVGVFTRFADEPITQLPLKASRLRMGLAGGRTRAIAAFDLHHTAAARFAALHRAAEVYAEHLVPGIGLTTASFLEKAGRQQAVDPRRLSVADGGPGRPDRRWQRAVSMTTGEQCWVPAGAVRPYGADNADGTYLATSAGRGSGRTAAEALGRGLLSALGFEALRGALHGKVSALTIPAAGLTDDRELDFLLRSASGYGLDAELVLLDDAGPAVTVLARAHDHERDQPVWALATELDAQRAIHCALRDLVGRVQLTRDDDPEVSGEPLDVGEDLLRGFEPGTLVAAGSAELSIGNASGGATWQEVLAALTAQGLDALAVATSGPEMARTGVATVRVLLVSVLPVSEA